MKYPVKFLNIIFVLAPLGAQERVMFACVLAFTMFSDFL